uniref:WD_REPEATS_REGION domain-containing protein n=1 Tax=Heligmosomoides polygyrus TaxID=6339 RepID=A0A183GLM1_HELPZ
LSREKDFEAPQLRQLLAECFVAVSMSLFCFALAVYDSRWLYRLAAHEMDALQFSLLFGGGGEKKVKSTPPVRPPRPRVRTPDSGSSPKPDGESLRAKFNTKVFGADVPSTVSVQTSSHPVEQILSQWVPPQKNIVQFFADKVLVHESPRVRCENAKPNSFAWELLRLALVEQQIYRIRQFLTLAGFDPSVKCQIPDVPAVAPRVESVLRLLDGWSMQLQQNLQSFCGGCPADLLPNMVVDDSLALTPRKYAMLTEKNNTPFESDDPRAGPLRRLWSYLTNQEHLQPIFIRHLFSNKGQQELPMERSDALADIENQPLPDAFKIIQKDNEPIVAFACNQEKPGWLVVSTGRELQEMDISGIFEESNNSSSWLYNRTELDVNLLSSRRDLSKENDDYQLLTENATQVIQAPKTATMVRFFIIDSFWKLCDSFYVNANVLFMQLTPWIIDRSKKGLQKIFKRTINGIRRIDSHPSAPFYVTGSSDGSVRVWEWGVGQPVYTARVAGQHAKVSKISFSCNGNKFAAVDGDGMLCLWQATHSTEHKKPFFSHRCHNKSASDVRFLGSSSSVLLTAGASSGEFNLALWDTLLPQSRALVHSWVAHTEGATVAMYIPNQQTIVSGGRHGELCLWDIRQRQLRATVKAFDYHQTVKTLVTDSAQDLIVAGSSDGDIKIWSADMNPQLMYSLPGEHAAKMAQSTMQGVQQLYIDQQLRLFSCGADASLKFRTLPSLYNMTQLI